MKNTRREFLKTGSAAAVLSTLMHSNSLMAEPYISNSLDKLTNEKGEFILTKLPYPYDGLEPVIDAQTVMLHHDIHQAASVNGYNKDIEKIKECLVKKDMDAIDFWIKKSAYHGSGAILHEMYWNNLIQNSINEPTGDLKKYIEKFFGSFDKFKILMTNICTNVDGNGWGILAYNPFNDQVSVYQCENHEKLVQLGVVPLMVIDVWEHAYYLKYQNRRGEYVSSLFSIINWDYVALRLNNAKKLM